MQIHIYTMKIHVSYILYRYKVYDMQYGGRNVEGVERCGRSRRKQSISCRALAHHPANSATLLEDLRILHEQMIPPL